MGFTQGLFATLVADAAPREFSGWVGLLAALDALTATAPDPNPR